MKQVSQDGDGVRTALFDLLEEGFRARDIKRSLASVGDEPARRARVLANVPDRALAPGYYRWAEYLFWLDDLRQAEIAVQNLSRDEAEGLRHLRAARGMFEHKHPACYKCGERQQTRFAPQCMVCQAVLQRSAA